ncbi:BTB domain-containing protein [Meloidogyne graminicola]|uniref:BTB domain-containing protein n=1 Tax=Meloidogyne graminicola TaxID=189291 RepID=A0A8S9ZU80_9BILA|nr:BTB domain-containing protein [Meloidogyne graminicola]
MFFDVSKVDIITSKIEWKIYNLNKLKDYMDSDQFLTSKQFYSRKCPSVAWELRVYPYTSTYTYTKRGRQYLMGTAVSLSQKRKINVDLNAKYKIYVVNSNGEYINIYFIQMASFINNLIKI